MERKDPDRLFRDKISDYSVEPSVEAMESMDQYFHRKRVKKALNHVWIAASVALLKSPCTVESEAIWIGLA